MVGKEALKKSLDAYERCWISAALDPKLTEGQPETLGRFRKLLDERPDAAERTAYDPGHLTGSALVVSPDRSRVLLTLHRKLAKWLQLGGHVDGSFDLPQAALREAKEESGLEDISFLAYEDKLGATQVPLPLDIDVHWIPPGKDPGHYHFDVRFALVAAHPERIAISDESCDLRWFEWKDAYAVTEEASLRRLYDKVRALP